MLSLSWGVGHNRPRKAREEKMEKAPGTMGTQPMAPGLPFLNQLRAEPFGFPCVLKVCSCSMLHVPLKVCIELIAPPPTVEL